MKLDGGITGTKIIKPKFNNEGTRKLGITKEAMGMVIKSLSNLYNDPVLATVRELICNGIDAESETGSPKPVKITMPSHANPNFMVEDFGIGMSFETVDTIYSMYGESTKQKSNDSIGGFGFGCKAPLAIERKFYVKTTKDGWTTLAEIYWDAANEFSMDPYEPEESDLPNGTLVKVPLVETSVYQFERAIYDFLSYVPKHLYELYQDDKLVDVEYALDMPSVKLICEMEDGTKIYHDSTHKSENNFHNHTNTLVMGPVRYTINRIDTMDYNRLIGAANNFTIVCPIGSVDLAPSRENVQVTKRSIDFIKKAYDAYVEAFTADYRKSIEEAETHGDALKAYMIAKNYISTNGIQYKEKDIPQYHTLGHTTRVETRSADESTTNYNIVNRIQLAGNRTTYFLKGSDFGHYADSSVRRGIKLFMDRMGLDNVALVLLNKDEPEIDNLWITDNDKFRFITRDKYLEEVSAQRKENRKNSPASTRGKIEYLVMDCSPRPEDSEKYISIREYNERHDSVPFDEIDKGLPYITKDQILRSGMGHIDELNRYSMQSILNFMHFVGYTGQLILLLDKKKPEPLQKRTAAVPFTFDAEPIFDKYFEDYCHDKLILSERLDYSFRAFVQNNRGIIDSLKDPRFNALLKRVEAKEEKLDRDVRDRFIFFFESPQRGVQELFDAKSKKKINHWVKRFTEEAVTGTLEYDSSMVISDYAEHFPIHNSNYGFTEKSLTLCMNAIYEEILSPKDVVV